ncbi:CPBP family glutamic-type intramembrane protease [Winogradskyella sp. PC D3.3]
MRDLVRKYEVWIFLVLAPISSAIFVYISSLGYIPESVYNHGRFFLLMFMLVGIVKYARGTPGLKEMFKPMLNWKVKPKWYLFSFLFAFTVALFTLTLKGFYLGSEYTDFFSFDPSIITFRRLFVLLVWAFVGEVVWVSYSVRQLSKKMKPFYSSLIVGIFWGLWWVPLIYLGIGVIHDLPVWPLLIHMMGAAGMCTIVYAKTKSGICVLILQFMLNVTGLVLPVSPRSGGVSTYIAFAVIYFLTMLIFMYFMNPTKAFKTTE